MSTIKRTGRRTSRAMGNRKPDEVLKAAKLMRLKNLLGDFSEQTGAQFG